MKYFKTKPSRNAKRYEITNDNFEKYTEHKHPFEQLNPDKTISQYGICPSCLNPIQLIGISKEIKRAPYGKHTGKNIIGLPRWNQLKYEYCPFAVNGIGREINEQELLPEVTDDVIELYELLRNQFDRVVYIISKELDIRCSANFWKNTLFQSLANNFYLYPWLTESNLPYIFAYKGMQHQSIYGQQVLADSELYNAILDHPYIKLLPVKNKDSEYMRIASKDGYLNLHFRFTNHRQNALNGSELLESIVFCIDDLSNNNTIFRRTVSFKENYFMNLINKKSNENKRNQILLDIASKNMPSLI